MKESSHFTIRCGHVEILEIHVRGEDISKIRIPFLEGYLLKEERMTPLQFTGPSVQVLHLIRLSKTTVVNFDTSSFVIRQCPVIMLIKFILSPFYYSI